jgi:dipeptidyl aminopeptidase/acylaminoacyl peptidase
MAGAVIFFVFQESSMSSLSARARHLLLAFSLVCAAVQAQVPATVTVTATVGAPLASFFENSAFSGAVLSPNAKYLAVKFSAKGRRVGLFVMDLATEKTNAVAEFADLDVGDVQWVNDNRLMFNINNKQIGQRDLDHYPGLYAVDRDGTHMRQLADIALPERTLGTRIREEMRLPWNTLMLEQTGAQDSEYVYVKRPIFNDGNLRYIDLLRVNTLTGSSKVVKRPTNDVRQWMLDTKGEPRVAVTEDKDVTTFYLRDPGSDEWRKMASRKLFSEKHTFAPLGFAPDGTLYVNTDSANADTSAIHTYDMGTGQLSAEPFIKTAGYDFNGELIANRDKVLGMRFTTDAESTMWFDAKMTALQKRVDDLLPATVNLLSPATRPETPWILVEAYSDVQPRMLLLFDTESGKFRKVGDAHPAIVPQQMARQVQLSYKARDGMTIPALLTLPNGKRKDLPMVILIHGGPWVRGSTWGWQRESQFLASRGYAVLEPSFRGTTGLGQHHMQSSFKQWGLTMQDDIADAAKFAIEKGYANAQRICLAGASYGGYATLMGLIKDPQLFKCGVDWVGVTDIELLLNGHWSFKSDMSDETREYSAPQMIGDLVKNKEQFRATSPLYNASKITQPLLLAYGAADMRVPKYHGDKFYNAVKATNKDVEFVVYPEEGHGWALPKNSIDFWGRVEKFLDKHIGQP